MPNSDIAQKAIEDFFDAFNANDQDAYTKTLHFPHIRINADGHVNIVRDVSESISLDTTLAYLTRHEGWHHSTLDSVEVVHKSENKVHFSIRFTRYKSDGTQYAVHNSLWIVIKKDDQWGIQARSSFAP